MTTSPADTGGAAPTDPDTPDPGSPPAPDSPETGASNSPTLLALRLLEVMLRRDGDWGVSELGAELGLARGRVHRHLTLLTEAGYLSRNAETRRYGLGWRLILMGRTIGQRSPVVTIAAPVMATLSEQVGNTIVFSQVTDSGIVVTETLSSSSTLGVSFPPGTNFAYNSSAQGKVALAFADAAQKARWSGLTDERRTPATITDPEELWAQVAEARYRGWATAPNETFDGMNALAAPVLGHDGLIAGTLAIVAPGGVIPEQPHPEQVTALLAAAVEISLNLGCPREKLPAALRQA
ncbi:IclR family transcriptional regulator [Granulicoccus phenolivorans]|uniref:IclR family transcriptional regulator n=1 Tax=Granulicoccus phenolivorans TaxID=266854 RepID=UPI000406F1AE|nr:IclR family transcriptional regulator [Granulicoccus phenolivorans]